MRHLLMIAALLCSGLAAATSPIERSFHARVQVGADGAVQAVETQGGLPAPIAAIVQDAVQKLAFSPATVAGEPAASKTTVWVRLRLQSGADEQLITTVLSITQANPFNRVPVYPSEAMRDGTGGRVWLELAILSDGTVDRDASRVESLELRNGRGQEIKRSRAGKDLAEAALEAAADWQIFPEEVAGVMRATKVLVPVTFCRVERGQACPEFAPRPLQGERVAAEAGVNLVQLTSGETSPET
ncbi:energy transducer TonB [Arenimonas alkanexedens]